MLVLEKGELSKRTVSGIMLTLLLIGMLTLAFSIQPVKASGTIYIRADGSVDPDTAPISTVDNITYTFTGNINDSIVVERSNIIVDGNGYTLQGNGAVYGFILSGISNVTIKRTNIKGFGHGVYLYSSSSNIISRNSITDSSYGIILLMYSSSNVISGNNITNNGDGVWLAEWSNNNTISGNNITNNWDGILLYYYSNNNSLNGNIIEANNGDGIRLSSSSNNILSGNNIKANNGDGIRLWDSSNNSISENNIEANNEYGIHLGLSPNSVLRNNTMVGNRYNFGVEAGYVLDFVHYVLSSVQDIDISNTVDGKPIYYSVSIRNLEIPSDAGYVALINSYNITVKGLELKNNGQGILFVNTTNSLIIDNNITSNLDGVWLSSSSNNVISRNNIEANNEYGISLYYYSSNNRLDGNNIEANNEYGMWLYYLSSNNSIHHNNFVNNPTQVYAYESINSWDDGYPSGGNYWSDYTGVDMYSGPYQNETGSDGIGDTPYIIDENNRDRYPLMNPWGAGTPVASFGWTPTIPEVGELVTFDASASMPIGGEIVGYEWDFGDGNYASGMVVTHTYSSAGNYTITLNVTDSEGLWDIEQKQIEVRAPPPPLTVSISPTSVSILVGQSATFTSTVSGGYTPYSYQWYLNGNPVSGATSNTWAFTPTTSGIYYVHLKVTDVKGNTAQSDAARLTVAAVPVGGYSIPIQAPATATPLTPYLILTAILTIAFATIKRKTTNKTKKPP